jgi:hypothetical protein
VEEPSREHQGRSTKFFGPGLRKVVRPRNYMIGNHIERKFPNHPNQNMKVGVVNRADRLA